MRLTLSADEVAQVVVDEIWNRGELELADVLFSEDFVNHGGLIPDLLHGPEAIKLSVALFRSAFPDFHIAVGDVETDGDATVVRWIAHSRPPLRDRPIGRKGGLTGITRFRIQGGKIAESWTVWDSRAALVRLGAATPKHGRGRNHPGRASHEPRAA